MKTALMVPALLVAPLAAAAQDAAIAGTVTDDTDGVLPGVTVEAPGAALPARRAAFTDSDGRYEIAVLPPGSYVATFTLAGFERLERDVELAEGLTATVDADLQLGGLFEEVTVSVTGTAIEARRPSTCPTRLPRSAARCWSGRALRSSSICSGT